MLKASRACSWCHAGRGRETRGKCGRNGGGPRLRQTPHPACTCAPAPAVTNVPLRLMRTYAPRHPELQRLPPKHDTAAPATDPSPNYPAHRNLNTTYAMFEIARGPFPSPLLVPPTPPALGLLHNAPARSAPPESTPQHSSHRLALTLSLTAPPGTCRSPGTPPAPAAGAGCCGHADCSAGRGIPPRRRHHQRRQRQRHRRRPGQRHGG